uniref:PNT domain-containing protein n=1 Tax=Plectus sambesii TaxID=2011161 RepID=A0A914XHS5_9BILA
MLPEPRSPLSLEADIFAANCQPTESTSSKAAGDYDDSECPPTFPAYYNFALIGSFDFSSCPPLPADPRLWSRSQVSHWCDLISQRLLLWPPVDAGRFPFNGRALCLLSRKMWAIRAPHCWELLETDIRLRMAALLADDDDDNEVAWRRK